MTGIEGKQNGERNDIEGKETRRIEEQWRALKIG
jgi:hypothetical protein